MKNLYNIFLITLLSLAISASPDTFAQRPGRNTRPASQQSNKPSSSTPTRTQGSMQKSVPTPNLKTRQESTKPSTLNTQRKVEARPMVETSKPNPGGKPAGSTTSRPTVPTAKPNVSTPKPSVSPSNPGGSSSAPSRQPGQGVTTRPNTSSPAPSPNRNPGGSTPNSSNTRPGNNPGNNTRPGVSTPPPGNNPGNGSRPGVSTPPPGGKPGPGAPAGNPGRFGPDNHFRPNVPRPHNNFAGPNYRPPHPGGGFWMAPPPSIYRPRFYAPLPPPPRVVVNYNVPLLNMILGTTFGSFIDLSINQLYNSGYKILGYADNVVYLSNVKEFGYSWPEVNVIYSDGLLSDVQYQYWSNSPSLSRFNKIYKKFTKTYGPPMQSTTVNGVTTVNWWAGGNTGYVTLQYAPNYTSQGIMYYYTTVTLSSI